MERRALKYNEKTLLGFLSWNRGDIHVCWLCYEYRYTGKCYSLSYLRATTKYCLFFSFFFFFFSSLLHFDIVKLNHRTANPRSRTRSPPSLRPSPSQTRTVGGGAQFLQVTHGFHNIWPKALSRGRSNDQYQYGIYIHSQIAKGQTGHPTVLDSRAPAPVQRRARGVGVQVDS